MMCEIQKIYSELLAPERKFNAATHFGFTCFLSAMCFAGSYFKKPALSPQYVLFGGVASIVVSHLTDSVIKASYDQNSDKSKLFIFTALKAGVVALTAGLALQLTGAILKSYNISLGNENAEFTMSTINTAFVYRIS